MRRQHSPGPARGSGEFQDHVADLPRQGRTPVRRIVLDAHARHTNIDQSCNDEFGNLGLLAT